MVAASTVSAEHPTVLYVVGSLWAGGIERLVTDMSLALARGTAWKPAVCCLLERKGTFLPALEAAGIEVHECRLTRRQIASFPFRFAALLRRIRPAVIHSHVSFSLPWQVLGARLAGVNSFILTQQNEYQYWRTHRLARARIRAYYWVARTGIAAHTAVSARVRHSFADLVGCSEKSIVVIHNSVDAHRFQPAGEAIRRQARERLALAPRDFVVGTVASLSPQKGHEFLIEAAAMLRDRMPHARFVCVGSGPRLNELNDITARHGLNDVVRFIGRHDRIDEIMPAFDCFALPSLWEGFPLAVVEAMAAAVPVVATDVGGVAEALDGGRFGTLVAPHDAEALAHAIQAVCADPDRAAVVAAEARRRAMECFGLKSVLQQYQELYQRVSNRA